jgi:hypothetical protein
MTPYVVALQRSLGLLAIIWLVMNLVGPGWLSLYRIASTGQLVMARITAIEPSNHLGCSFEYTVEGAQYRGHGSGCSPRGLGAELPVTYAPIDPTYATASNAGEELLRQVLIPPFVAVFAGFVSAFMGRRSILNRA